MPTALRGVFALGCFEVKSVLSFGWQECAVLERSLSSISEELSSQVRQLILHGYDDFGILEHYTLQTSQLTLENVQECRKDLRPPPRVCRRSEMIRNLLGSTPGVFNKIEGNPLSESKLRSLDQRWKALTAQFDVEHDYVARRVEVPGVMWCAAP
jgi:hypothetical protein